MLNAVLAVNAADPPDWLQEISARDNVSYVVWTQDPWAPIFRDGEPMPNNPEQIKYTIKLQGCTNQYISGLFLISSLRDGYQNLKFQLPSQLLDKTNTPRPDRFQLRIGGAIRSRKHGVTIGPLFAVGDFPDEDIFDYVPNYESIKEFPNVELASYETIPFWFTIDATDLEPGLYTSTVVIEDDKGLENINIEIEILPIKISKESPLGVLYWASIPNNELKEAYMKDLVSHGANIFFGDFSLADLGSKLTIIGSGAFHSKAIGWQSAGNMKNQLKRSRSFLERKLKGAVLYYVNLAKEAGLDYDQWAIEIYDEPTDSTSEVHAELAKIIKEADEKVQIFANPAAHWERNSVTIEKTLKILEPYVDFWFPFSGNLNRTDEDIVGYLKTLGKPIGYYSTPGIFSSKDENAAFGYYRKAAMIAYHYDLDAFGFWAYNTYYSSPWDDFDSIPGVDWPDAAVVYPGPKGPITTRNWEAVREGIQDYKLVVVLEELIEKAKAANLTVTASEEVLVEIAEQFFQGDDLAILNNARTRLFDEILKLQSLLSAN
mgnify:FL=1